jgi:hypothetical protein
MNNPNHKRDAYRQLLTTWIEALAVARDDGIYPGLAQGSLPGPIDVLTDRGFHMRFVKLVFCTGSSRPGVSNDERFPHGLPQTRPLTPEQQDYVTCQQARHAAEAETRRNRGGHTRFQELLSDTHRREAELDTNPDLLVHLNPIRIWARFVTSVLLKGEADLPAEVLFFAAANAIRAAVLEPKARALLNVLAWFNPCTVRQFWLLNKHSGRTEIVCFCRDLARAGLVAFG